MMEFLDLQGIKIIFGVVGLTVISLAFKFMKEIQALKRWRKRQEKLPKTMVEEEMLQCFKYIRINIKCIEKDVEDLKEITGLQTKNFKNERNFK